MRKSGFWSFVFLGAVLLTTVGLLSGCASAVSTMKLTSEEKQYVDEVKQFPLEFEIDKKDDKDAWGRAQSFIGKYSSMKLQIVSDYNLQTYNPTGAEVQYGYSVTKTPAGTKEQISVDCQVGNIFKKEDAKMNAHILAYYISTGEIFPNLVQQ
jgi:hypothetical protein